MKRQSRRLLSRTQKKALFKKFPRPANASSIIIPGYDFGDVTDTAKQKNYHDFFHSNARVKAIFGGNKSGKTHVNVFRQLGILRNNPGCMTWAATNTSDMIGQTLWPKFKELTSPEERPEKNIAWSNKKKGIPSLVKWSNGAVTWFKTYEQGWETFQSADVHDILLDEECEKKIFQECLPRLMKYNAQLGLSMTPLKGKTWPYSEIDQANRPGKVESWRVSLFQNPFIPQEYKDELVSIYGVDEIDRRVYGMFTILEGAILKEFDDQVHICHDFPAIPSDWRRIRSFDLGARAPFVCGWYALSPDGILYKYDEYYSTTQGTDIETHVLHIRQREAEHLSQGIISHPERGDWFECSISDHELQTRIELDKYGIPTMPAIKKKQLSWEIANRLLKQRPAIIRIAPRCKETARELPMYHYKAVREGAELKEVEDKVDDHTVDEFLYAVMHFFGGEEIDYENIEIIRADEIV